IAPIPKRNSTTDSHNLQQHTTCAFIPQSKRSTGSSVGPSMSNKNDRFNAYVPLEQDIDCEKEFLWRETELFLLAYCALISVPAERDEHQRDALFSSIIRTIPKARIRAHGQALQRMSRRELRNGAKMALNQCLLLATRWPWVAAAPTVKEETRLSKLMKERNDDDDDDQDMANIDAVLATVSFGKDDDDDDKGDDEGNNSNYAQNFPTASPASPPAPQDPPAQVATPAATPAPATAVAASASESKPAATTGNQPQSLEDVGVGSGQMISVLEQVSKSRQLDQFIKDHTPFLRRVMTAVTKDELEPEGRLLRVPPYCLDKHTRRG
ncbi:unnamed protein product, partial [Amoebophrya sp. A25]